MITRREWLRIAAGTGAALYGCTSETPDSQATVQALVASPSSPGVDPVQMRPIPSTGEDIPVVGLGGRWISTRSTAEELAAHREVLHELARDAEGPGRVFDSAYGYGGGGSEEYAGQWAAEDGFGEGIFWATKVNAAGRGGGDADPTAVRDQIERSFTRLRREVIDLNQVHNMSDPPTQLGILQEYKDEGRIRYIGITTTSESQYDHLARVMREYPIDFIGIDYSLDHRVPENEIFEIATGEGIAVMVYLPFGRRRMWDRIGDRPLPDWAADFDAHSWAQLMLKFTLAHPAVTIVAPGTGNPEHMIDNLGAGRGRMPSPDDVARMIELEQSLPTI